MSVDRGVPSGTRQVLVLSVRDVQVCLWVPVLLCETEIDDIDLVSTFTDTHQEVVGLDISVDEVSGVNVFYPRDKLVGEEEDGLEREFAVAEVEEIFERWAAARQRDSKAYCAQTSLTVGPEPWRCSRIRYRTIVRMVHRHLQQAICKLSTRTRVVGAWPLRTLA
jgi:hypothetical protein